MDDDPKRNPPIAEFLSRWSRLKQQAREEPPVAQAGGRCDGAAPRIAAGRRTDAGIGFQRIFASQGGRGSAARCAQEIIQRPAFQCHGRPRYLRGRLFAAERAAGGRRSPACGRRRTFSLGRKKPKRKLRRGSRSRRLSTRNPRQRIRRRCRQGETAQPPAIEPAADVASEESRAAADVTPAAGAAERKS